jgi:hypothetical protein
MEQPVKEHILFPERRIHTLNRHREQQVHARGPQPTRISADRGNGEVPTMVLTEQEAYQQSLEALLIVRTEELRVAATTLHDVAMELDVPTRPAMTPAGHNPNRRTLWERTQTIGLSNPFTRESVWQFRR